MVASERVSFPWVQREPVTRVAAYVESPAVNVTGDEDAELDRVVVARTVRPPRLAVIWKGSLCTVIV
ncbi:hypothetical protein Sm713_75160 [Streptomyces sp. TS71-3]|nr:hypothetical protein Sm713_75160 [Streptomyces sp. TS71-3]